MILKARFAPSPTGLLHIGNARSAVINWAHIKSKGGELILRIDDTDSIRIKSEYERFIKDDLKWLGLDWSKSFNQSDRFKSYETKIKELKKSKRLYPCFETPDELSLKKKNLLSAGKPPIYDRSSLKITEKQIQDNINNGKKPHWRFKLENKIIKWNDLIKGNVSFDSKNISDPILIREDNSLLYHLPSVIDDIEENITDIIRGDDHITNTAVHIQIFEALNSTIPSFGHHPFITDKEGKGYGKRLGSLSIQKIKKDGFESITILNYLLTIGTNQNISKEKNINKLLKNFNINNLAKSSPKFSLNILENLNKFILQSYDFIDVEKKFKNHNLKNVNEDFWLFIKNNIYYFSEALNWWKIINTNEVYPSTEQNYLNIAGQLIPESPFDVTSWDKWTKKINIKTGRSGKELYMPIRLALTGQIKGPELKLLMPLLTKEHILRKLGL